MIMGGKIGQKPYFDLNGLVLYEMYLTFLWMWSKCVCFFRK